jgi:hypothetical protein
MTNIGKHVRIELSTAVTAARRRHRTLIEAALGWQSERERQSDPDHFALICAAVDDAAQFLPSGEMSPTRWTRISVYQVLRSDIPNWCAMQGCRWPLEVAEAMWEWFDFLHATGRMHPASDPVAELRKPLSCYGWLDQDGRKLPPDARQPIACECLLPYRETTELLHELVRQCERRGDDPLDRLRELVGRPSESSTYGYAWVDEEERPPDLDELS